ncbi:MAG: hypothetical protein ACOC8E_02870 [Planctomycetota bacterium]
MSCGPACGSCLLPPPEGGDARPKRAGWAELGAKFAARPALVQRTLFDRDDETDPVPEHVRVTVEGDHGRPGHLRLIWNEREEWTDWAALREGAYLLRTNLNDRTPEDLWRTYIQLTDAEAAFRTIKTDLVVRPIYHQTERRVHAHILVAFLAYAMWKTLQKWMEQAGLGRGVRTVMEEIARIKCGDVILSTRSGREIELRCVSRPDGHQRTLLQRLGLKLPARLGQPRWRDRADTLSGM